MTIAEVREICKRLGAGEGRVPRDTLLVGIIVVASFLSFGLGYLSGVDASSGGEEERSAAPETSVIASKYGTKYYLPTCSGVERISEANRVVFPSAAAARSEGYTPAENCTGL